MSDNGVEKPQKLYEQIKQYLLDGIASGQWPDGSRIPSEHELMEVLGASRMTVNRAVRELSADGLLNRVQGLGTFVRAQVPRSALLEIYDISEDIQRRGNVHKSQVLLLEAIRADEALASAFMLRRGAKLFHSEIVHFENDVPVQFEARFVSPRFAPEYLNQDFTQQTSNRYLQGIAPPSEVEHIVHAVRPDERAQALLEIGPHEPCLQVERRTWTEAGPATRSVLTHPGSRYSLGSRYAVADWNAKKGG
ncbi:histidine utilization repressor [Acidocella sp.]|uniref:histidine utilization repressor n=1 Tax=Acidocella sp. TaxID=50710 RepID=UPI0017FFF8EB|nr:histidine utilization repressor [Acidocella sp.]NNM57708.1 histidine utilization repressor [Acidocella sp.]